MLRLIHLEILYQLNSLDIENQHYLLTKLLNCTDHIMVKQLKDHLSDIAKKQHYFYWYLF